MLLSVSLKGIQSFEQGWRSIPDHVERQMLFLAAMKAPQEKERRSCWNVKGCTEDMKRQCPAWEFRTNRFCWMVNGMICQGKVQESWQQKMEICRNCTIFRSGLPQFALREEA